MTWLARVHVSRCITKMLLQVQQIGGVEEPKTAQPPSWLLSTEDQLLTLLLAMLVISYIETGCMQAHLRRTTRSSLLRWQSALLHSLQRRALSHRSTHLLLLQRQLRARQLPKTSRNLLRGSLLLGGHLESSQWSTNVSSLRVLHDYHALCCKAYASHHRDVLLSPQAWTCVQATGHSAESALAELRLTPSVSAAGVLETGACPTFSVSPTALQPPRSRRWRLSQQTAMFWTRQWMQWMLT